MCEFSSSSSTSFSLALLKNRKREEEKTLSLLSYPLGTVERVDGGDGDVRRRDQRGRRLHERPRGRDRDELGLDVDPLGLDVGGDRAHVEETGLFCVLIFLGWRR